MFIEQRKKKNYRTFIYAAIIAVLCMIIVVIAWPSDSSELAADVNSPGVTDVQKPSDTDVYNPGKYISSMDGHNQEQSYDDEQQTAADSLADDDTDDEIKDIAQAGATYYLVRRDGSQIKVYFIDESGNQIELETTEIIYEMLGTEDQKLFDQGYRVDTQEQLAVLLQDFES